MGFFFSPFAIGTFCRRPFFFLVITDDPLPPADVPPTLDLNIQNLASHAPFRVTNPAIFACPAPPPPPPFLLGIWSLLMEPFHQPTPR